MKILIVASWFPTPDSPVNGVFIAEQAAALATRHDVTVLAPVVADPRFPRKRSLEEAGAYRVIRTGIPARNHLHALCYSW